MIKEILFVRKGNSNFIPITEQARGLPTDKLKILYVSVNAVLYIIQVSISFSGLQYYLFMVVFPWCSAVILTDWIEEKWHLPYYCNIVALSLERCLNLKHFHLYIPSFLYGKFFFILVSNVTWCGLDTIMLHLLILWPVMLSKFGHPPPPTLLEQNCGDPYSLVWGHFI